MANKETKHVEIFTFSGKSVSISYSSSKDRLERGVILSVYRQNKMIISERQLRDMLDNLDIHFPQMEVLTDGQ